MTCESSKPVWAHALGKISSGLFIITVNSGDNETGFLASWVQQCSFEPPQLTIAVNNQRPVRESMQPGVLVTVNVVPEGGKSLIAHFGKGFMPRETAFDGIAIDRLPGRPPRLQAALAWLETCVVALHPSGDHTLVMARVVDGRVLHDGKPTVHIRRDGTRY